MTLKDLIQRLHTEHRNRLANGFQVNEHSVNVVVHNKNVDHKGKGKAIAKASLKPNGKNFKKQAPAPAPAAEKKTTFKGKCHACGKHGHMSKDCRSRKATHNEANLTEADLCAVVTEANNCNEKTKEWWYDTGATTHICNDRLMFNTYQKNKSEEALLMGNEAASKIEGKGTVVLRMTSGKEITLKNVKHVPDMRKNLISGTLMSKGGFSAHLENDILTLKKWGFFLGRGFVKDGLVKMCIQPVVKQEKKNNVASTSENVITNVSENVGTDSMNNNKPVAYLLESFNIWHERLGHVNYKSINRLMNLNLIPKCKMSKEKCEVCVQAKLTKTPSPQVQRKNAPLDLIHTDLCDLKSCPTRSGKKYFVTFIDDHTKYCYVYLLHSKDEALDKFKEYKREVENQLNKTIKVVRSDRGGEYDGRFNAFCMEHGIIHQTTAPYSPESNGVAEQKNRTLKEMMNAMLQESGLAQN